MSRTETLSAIDGKSTISVKRIAIWMGVGLFLMLMIEADLKDSGYRLAYSKSGSLPEAVFFVTPLEGEPLVGDYLAFHAPKNAFFSGRVTKRVVGVSGDRIEVEGRIVRVNGHEVGRAKPLSQTGIPLTLIEPQIVPEGYVFVEGDHIDSFDSRYAEFGLVPDYLFIGKARAIF